MMIDEKGCALVLGGFLFACFAAYAIGHLIWSWF
jgi:hypothetical protein